MKMDAVLNKAAVVERCVRRVREEYRNDPARLNDPTVQDSIIISVDTAKRMKAMVGFRNIAIHDDQKVNLDIVRNIVERHLGDLIDFSNTIVRALVP